MFQLSSHTLKNTLGIVLVILSCAWLFALPFLPLSGNKAIAADLLPANHGAYALVFFGYPGCNQICPATLRVMSEVRHDAPEVELVFINLDWKLSAHTSTAYARYFHPDFLVYHLDAHALIGLLEAFSVSFSRTESQLVSHSDYLYLLNKDLPYWRIRHVYRNPAQPKAILSDLKQLLSLEKTPNNQNNYIF
jgi:protein SCO1